MVSVPEGFKALGANFLVGSAVHDDHDEEHDMTSEATGLGVVDLKRELLADLSAFDVNEVDVMGGSVNHGPESHGISDLSMEPDVLVCREEPHHLRADNADDVAKHRDEDHAAVVGENKTSTAGNPDGIQERVETGETGVGLLGVPPITEDEEMRAIPKNVKSESFGSQKLPLEPRLSHDNEIDSE